MTWSAALSGAALRTMRTAVGRRALEVALLVGAVFVLGMLCGERAQAADGMPGETAPVSPSTGTAGTVGTAVPDPVNSARTAKLNGGARPVAGRTPPADSRKSEAVGTPAADPVPLPLGTLGRSVGERVVRPVGELVGAVTGRSAVSPEELPALPGLTRPAPLPYLPGPPAVPGHALPAPITPGPEPEAPAPRPETPTAPPPPSADASSVPQGRAGAVAPVAFGPDASASVDTVDADGTTRGGEGHGAPRGAAHTEPAPAPHAPADQPDGAVGHRSTADNGAPRHGDAHAVTPCPRPPLRLVPGATEHAEATGTRDRHRDVPVPPA
ncbi:hypothetical protein [Streptomyces griseomycini]|uniref:Uncharacterized protein n=2 Tax=Streptomyces griseomycini TaxID=66895 RepID=A0A7W7PQB5_9ACTN|nr:hypothetical protein [Streptomyces griseomycini]MBB4897453.1 hypothetical protein [Streptomyces griseomycini]